MKTYRSYIAIIGMLFCIHLAFAQDANTDSSIELVTPKGGEFFKVGNTLKVQWILHHGANPGGGLLIQVSPDEGMSWVRIVSETIKNGDAAFYHDSVGTFEWTILDSLNYFANLFLYMASDKCQLMIGAPYDEAFVPGQSNTFTISPSNTSIRTSFHAGGDTNRGYSNSQRRLHAGMDRSDVEIFTLDGRKISMQESAFARRWNQSGNDVSGLLIVRERAGYQMQNGIICR